MLWPTPNGIYSRMQAKHAQVAVLIFRVLVHDRHPYSPRAVGRRHTSIHGTITLRRPVDLIPGRLRVVVNRGVTLVSFPNRNRIRNHLRDYYSDGLIAVQKSDHAVRGSDERTLPSRRTSRPSSPRPLLVLNFGTRVGRGIDRRDQASLSHRGHLAIHTVSQSQSRSHFQQAETAVKLYTERC